MEPTPAPSTNAAPNLAFPAHIAAMRGPKINAPNVPVVALQRYLRLWIYAWKAGPMEVVKGYPDNDKPRMVAALLGEAAKGTGFGVLIDRADGSVEYFLTRQVNLAEARLAFHRYRSGRTKDIRKPMDRVVWEGNKPHIRRSGNTGAWDEFYKHGL